MMPPIRLRMLDDHLKRLRSEPKVAKTVDDSRGEFRDTIDTIDTILNLVFDFTVALGAADSVHAVQSG
jgi:hypothetical protein